MKITITTTVMHRHGLGNCAVCPTRDKCTTLCTAAEIYADQDFVQQMDNVRQLKGNEITDFSELQSVTPSRDEEIIALYFVKQKKIMQISEILGIDHSYVSRRVKKYKEKLIENLKK